MKEKNYNQLSQLKIILIKKIKDTQLASKT